MLGSGILWLDKQVARAVLDEAYAIIEEGYALKNWGCLGPDLVSNIGIALKLEKDFSPFNHFYAIENQQRYLFESAEKKEYAKTLIADSFVAHIWNKDRNGIIKGSLLEELMSENFINQEIQDQEIVEMARKQAQKIVDLTAFYRVYKKKNPNFGWIQENLKTSIKDVKNSLKKEKQAKWK